MVCLAGPARVLILKNPLTRRERTIVFETCAYISYNLKFVY